MQMHKPRREGGIRWISIKCTKHDLTPGFSRMHETRPDPRLFSAGASLGAGRRRELHLAANGLPPGQKFRYLAPQGYRHKAMQMHEPRREAGIRWGSIKCMKQDLTVRSNSSQSSGLKSRPGSCPYAPVA